MLDARVRPPAGAGRTAVSIAVSPCRYEAVRVAVPVQLETSVLRKVIKRLHFPLEIMLVCVRWYAAMPLVCASSKR